jgi:hypothetical protein
MNGNRCFTGLFNRQEAPVDKRVPQHGMADFRCKTVEPAGASLRTLGNTYKYFLKLPDAISVATPRRMALGSRMTSGLTLTGNAR